MLRTDVEISIPAEMPVQIRNRAAATLRILVMERASRARNGRSRSLSKYQRYSLATIFTGLKLIQEIFAEYPGLCSIFFCQKVHADHSQQKSRHKQSKKLLSGMKYLQGRFLLQLR